METEKKVFDIKVKLNFKEYVSFNYMINRKFLKNVTMLGALFLVVLIVLTLQKGSISKDTMFNIVEVASVDVFVVGLIFYSVRIRTKKMWDNNKIIQEEKSLMFSNAGISHASETSSANIWWNKVFKIEETNIFIAIFISNLQAFVIPKRNFSNLEELKLFKDILKTNISKEKLHLKDSDVSVKP